MIDTPSAIGTSVIFEDEEVRVWKLELDPSESTPVHHHAHDYVFVVVEGGTTETVDADGSSSTSTDSPGDAVFHRAPLTHHLRNLGDGRYVNVIVELLRGAHDQSSGGPTGGQVSS